MHPLYGMASDFVLYIRKNLTGNANLTDSNIANNEITPKKEQQWRCQQNKIKIFLYQLNEREKNPKETNERIEANRKSI